MLQITRPRTVRTVVEMRDIARDWRRAGDLVALVPTMGGLHEGHLSLIRAARRRARRVIATIFVNPAQFGAGEDFAAYPRDEIRDAELLAAAGCDLIYAPPLSEIYPDGFATSVTVDTGTNDPVSTYSSGTETRLFAAARLGKTRLIDNVPVERTGLTE